MIPAEEMTELVLVPELLVPIRSEEEMIGALAGPPRALEVPVEQGVSADERSRDRGAGRNNL
jgi:hypothetical protein